MGEIKRLERPLKVSQSIVKVPGSPPDVDTDFHTVGRHEVINYVAERYGHENVANIITFSKFKAKNSFKSICTIYNVPFATANKISKLIPDAQDGKEMSLEDVYDELHPRYAEGEDFRNAVVEAGLERIVDYARPLNKRVRGTGVHACGIIISKYPLSNTIPTQVRQDDNALITQWTYPQCESIGLIKMDFLGLDTLDVIYGALENIERVGKEVPNMKELTDGDMDDKVTFDMLQKGETVGVFQLGGQGVRDLLLRVKPTGFMDIAATTALYRPGPMKMNAHNEYADRKNGREKVTYVHQDFHGTVVEDILKETYGLIVFQEQCMLIATDYAGMTPYESDKLRKAIGKKKMDIMMKLKPKFIEGCINAGASEGAADLLWNTIEEFGKYGFNKSHSISYAIAAFETAYLKAHYPAEFMASLVQQNIKSKKKFPIFIQEVSRMGLKIGPVDVNESQIKMSVPKDRSKYDIIYGLKGVKQVNDDIAFAIVDEREKNGKYKSMQDFLKRVNKKVDLNAGAISRLAKAGAFDCFDVSRRAIVEKVPQLMKVTKTVKKQAMSLFDMVGDESGDLISTVDLSAKEYPYSVLIKNEFDSLGFFVSGHPIDRLGVLSRTYHPTELKVIANAEDRQERTFLGTITDIESKTNKNGRRSIKLTISEGKNSIETFVPNYLFPRIEKAEEILRIQKLKDKKKDFKVGEKSKEPERMVEIFYDETIEPLYLETSLPVAFKMKKQRGRMSLSDIQFIETAYDGSIPFYIRLENSRVNELAPHIANVCSQFQGDTYIYAKLDGNKTMPLAFKVDICRDFIVALESVVGEENILTKEI